MESVLFRKQGEAHFTKEFDGKTTSDRIILAQVDNCRVKVTMFRPKKGFHAADIAYECDETVHMVSGQIRIHLPDGTDVDLDKGDTYLAPAGAAYGLTALADAEVFCVFSQAGDGPLPDGT
jgi:quercetin dioxygenase-like cupin family protein